MWISFDVLEWMFCQRMLCFSKTRILIKSNIVLVLWKQLWLNLIFMSLIFMSFRLLCFLEKKESSHLSCRLSYCYFLWWPLCSVNAVFPARFRDAELTSSLFNNLSACSSGFVPLFYFLSHCFTYLSVSDMEMNIAIVSYHPLIAIYPKCLIAVFAAKWWYNQLLGL